MEADSHNSIGFVESFLDSISVMNIDIQIKNSWVHLQKLQNAEYYIVNIAESTSL